MRSTILLILALALIILPIAGCGGAPQASCPKIGDKAPDLTLVDMHGNNVSMSDYAGKPIIINTWSVSCTQCKEEMPYFNEVFRKYGANQLVFLSINTLDGSNAINDYLSENGYTFKVLRDDGRKIINAKYGLPDSGPLKGDPYTIFINNKGCIQNIKIGSFASKEELMIEVNKILPAG
jgi:peroxiredoxin